MHDLRLPLLGAAAWAGSLLGALGAGDPWPVAGALLALLGVVAAVGRWRPGARSTSLALGLVLVAAAAVAGFRGAQVRHNPVADLAARGATVEVVGTVASDPSPVAGAFGSGESLRLQVRSVSGRGSAYTLRAGVLVLGDEAWARVPLGATVRTGGELRAADDGDLAALLVAHDDPEVIGPPSVWWRAAGAVRSAIRDAVAGRPAAQAALVPALVDGDDAAVPEEVASDFRTTGLTHLLAVSGTNLTLVVGFLLVVARWCRVRGRWLYVVGAAGIAGFVLLARTEPSVLRAAVMGAIGLVAMGRDGRQRGLRVLGGAVVVLLLLDPGLARSVGFALSVLATAGILLLGPWWRDALARWLPRWLAEAVAVPAAAQLACTPLIAVISGQVSLVAVVANLLAEPAVGPATVLGLLGGLLHLLWAPLGVVAGVPAGWCVGWIVVVAHRCASLPTAQAGWGTGPLAIVALTALTLVLALQAPRLLRHRVAGPVCCLMLVVVTVVRLPTPGWPPDGWVMVMCDVGQGDGLVLATGPGSALVVDAGPDAAPMDHCLDGLGITTVPLLLFTHFDADHVTGASAVFAGRRVGQVWTTQRQDPAHGVEIVDDAARAAGVTPAIAPWGATLTLGELTLQVLWPRTDLPAPPAGTASNEGSVVLLVRDQGLTFLLTGDLDPEASAAVAAEVPGLHVDVLKVPHHGSRFQDEDWLLSLRPEVALTSVGADNTYGHPAASTLDPLAAAGVAVYRTDRDGSIAVLPGPRVVTH